MSKDLTQSTEEDDSELYCAKENPAQTFSGYLIEMLKELESIPHGQLTVANLAHRDKLHRDKLRSIFGYKYMKTPA